MSFPNLQHIDLKLLKAMQVLLEERNVTRAAERVHLSQSAMSRLLNRLRDLFDDPLFVKTSDGMVPTTRALEIKEPLRATLEQLDKLFQQQVFDPASSSRMFRLQSTDYSAHAYLPAIVREFQRQAPNAQIDQLHVRETSLLNQPIHTSDLVLCSNYVSIPDNYHRLLLGWERYCCIMARNHPLANKKLTLDNYLSYSHVLIKMGGGGHILGDELLAKLKRKRHIGLKTPHMMSALETLGQTQLLLTSSALLAQRHSRNFSITTKELPIEFPDPHYYLVWANNVHRDAGIAWFRNMCAKVIRDMIPYPVAEGDLEE